MKAEAHIELPTNTCVYERYHPDTLAPVNRETSIRLQELGWRMEDFKDRTVLDIGCNSGLLTLYALRLGARQVSACDVQEPLVDFVSRVVQNHRLPVTVRQLAFDKLDIAQDQADVVLFMEVLHWSVSQGLDLRGVIRKLSQLTKNILYIEFPWSVKEPSIQKQTKLTEDRYSADAVLDELTKYFHTVKVARFMHYFGFHSGSTRVLVEAREKRPEANLLGQLSDVYSLNVPLSRGRNESYLLSSSRGPLFAKLLASESTLRRLSESTCNRLFDEIRAASPATVVCPIKQNGKYLLPALANQTWMLFPFVGRMPSVGKAKPHSIEFSDLIDLFISIRRDLRPLSSELLDKLRQEGLLRDFRPLTVPAADWAEASTEFEAIKTRAIPVLDQLINARKEQFDALCHGDLQTGNFLLDEDNKPHVVDLDTISVGTIYSDGLMGLIWRGAEVVVMEHFCEKLRPEESRAVSAHDMAYAIGSGILWLSTVKSLKVEANVPDQIARLKKGLSEALSLHARLLTP